MRCVALLSGGLDSQLAVRLMTIQTPFECCQHQTAEVARRLGVRLNVLPPEATYLDLIREPSFGYGRGANPCVDCRIHMFQRAGTLMRQVGAEFDSRGHVRLGYPFNQRG
jgi:tRNA-uridine 2-sulfurtransferase